MEAGRGLEAVVDVAVERVKRLGKGLVLGLGTGRTSTAFIRRLAEAAEPGMLEAIIPTSIQAEEAAARLGFKVGSLYNFGEVDIYVDSFDQCSRSGDVVKGMGGALAREKLLTTLARTVLLIGTEEKLSEKLTAPIPLEALPPAAPAVARLIQMRGWRVGLKESEGKAGPVITDNGNVLMLAELGVVEEPARIEVELKMLPGVVEVGIFPNRGYKVIIGMNDGTVREIT
ncbi:MAG: ribose 5-phosphate isomerase A [Nitrososphaerota archaeon]|nr:ribose 5-phosphate isomerase A [Candidatus Calditenuaceae archaeon]MDW8073554.1 ribose 5-phosphate isomerase A [Nitrososphaerota archaeon]